MGNPGKAQFRMIKFALKDALNLPDKTQGGNSTVRRIMRCSRANFASSPIADYTSY